MVKTQNRECKGEWWGDRWGGRSRRGTGGMAGGPGKFRPEGYSKG